MKTQSIQEHYDQVILKISNESAVLNDVVEHAKFSLQLIKNAVDTLAKDKLDSKPEEVQIRNVFYAKFQGLKFYYKELIWIAYNKPIASNYEMIGFYKQEIEFIRHFFTRHAAQYQLHKIKMMELEPEDLPAEHQLEWAKFSLENEPLSEEYSMTAKFIGYESLLIEVLRRLQEHEDLDRSMPRGLYNQKLLWTGKGTNLVELAYGLYETGQINNGQATLSEIMTCLKKSFQLNIESPYRTYQDLRRRKRINPVTFLDQMRLAVLNRMEAELGYVPGSY